MGSTLIVDAGAAVRALSIPRIGGAGCTHSDGYIERVAISQGGIIFALNNFNSA
jgi:hypothetical protein